MENEFARRADETLKDWELRRREQREAEASRLAMMDAVEDDDMVWRSVAASVSPPEGGLEPKSPGQRPKPDLSQFAEMDWEQFWAASSDDVEWCIEPLLPRGRQAGLFAVGGTGKSLLALDIAAAKATGRSILGNPADDPVSVVYMDLEMGPDDLKERLMDMGYSEADDLSNLHYYQLPTLPALDSVEGGDVMMAIVDLHAPELVVIDTMARAVEGDENSADTYRGFFRCTGSRLKAAGVALLRLDHAGKDPAKGQRGSSSKNDDLDIVWLLRVENDQATLQRFKSRVSYLAFEVSMTLRTDPTVAHILAPAAYPAGTLEVTHLLDEYNVDINTTVTSAQAILTRHGQSRRKAVVMAAQAYRRKAVDSRPFIQALISPDTTTIRRDTHVVPKEGKFPETEAIGADALRARPNRQSSTSSHVDVMKDARQRFEDF